MGLVRKVGIGLGGKEGGYWAWWQGGWVLGLVVRKVGIGLGGKEGGYWAW